MSLNGKYVFKFCQGQVVAIAQLEFRGVRNMNPYFDLMFSFKALLTLIDHIVRKVTGCDTVHDLIELNRSLREELHSKCQV